MTDIEGAHPNWRFQSRRPPPDGSEGFKNNIELDFSGIKESAATSVGDNRGCRHFPPRLSESWMPRRLLKEVTQNLDNSFRPEGTRKVPQPDRSAEMTRWHKRRFEGVAGTVDEVGRLQQNEPHFDNLTAGTWDSKYIQSKRRVFAECGDRMVARPSDELSMERTMCRKKRVDLGSNDKDIQGNKCYSNPEYSHKYWSQEGLNYNSTMRVRVPPVHSTHTLDMNEEMLNWKAPRRHTFAQKQAMNGKRDEMNDVSLLPKSRRQNAASKYSSLLQRASATDEQTE